MRHMKADSQKQSDKQRNKTRVPINPPPQHEKTHIPRVAEDFEVIWSPHQGNKERVTHV